MIALWNHCRFWQFFHFCPLVYDCTVKSPPFLTTFSLLPTRVWLHCKIIAVFAHFLLFSACVWLHSEITAVLTTFSLLFACVWLHSEVTAVLPTFSLLFACVLLHCKITAVLTTFSLLPASVWLHREITAVLWPLFTVVHLCMIALWNHCRFWLLFYYCLLVYDCIVKLLPFLAIFFTILCLCMIAMWNHCRFWPLFSLFSACVWLKCYITAVFNHFFSLLYAYASSLCNYFFPIACLCMIAL